MLKRVTDYNARKIKKIFLFVNLKLRNYNGEK